MLYSSKAARALLSLVLTWGAGASLSAAPITPERAKTLASQYIKVKPSPKKAMGTTTADTPYYIYEGADDRGFVIVSADDALGEVLAYSRENRFDTTPDSPAALFTQGYAEDYAAYRQNGVAKTTKSAKVTSQVGPLLKTRWDQTQPFNGMLPNNYSLTGCGPTAMAQVINYHRWPEHGRGSNSYVNNDGETLSGTFDNDYYDYDKMLDYYGYVDPKENNDAVALLMRDCGLASSCSYTQYWSGAFEFQIRDAFNWNFDYTAALYERIVMGQQRFYEMVVNEIISGFPVIMAGGQGTSGHVFVADGVDERGYVHFNFGWRGLDDGFYKLPYYGFRTRSTAVVSRPNKPGSAPLPEALHHEAPQIYFGGAGILQINGVAANSTVARQDSMPLRMTEFTNLGQPFSGDMGIAVVDAAGKTVAIYGSTEHDKGGFTSRLMNDTLGTDGSFIEGNDVMVNVRLHDMKNGYYKLKAICARYDTDSLKYHDWVEVRAFPQMEIELTDDSLRVSEQGGYGRGWQLGGEPVWNEQRLMPGDNVSVIIPLDNLRGVQNDGTLTVNLVDDNDGQSYSIGSTAIAIDKYYTDSVTVEGSIPLSCQDGQYQLLLTVDNDTVKNLHDAAPSLVTIGNTVTGISELRAKDNGSQTAYDLQGRRVARPSKGVFIVDGKKLILK